MSLRDHARLDWGWSSRTARGRTGLRIQMSLAFQSHTYGLVLRHQMNAGLIITMITCYPISSEEACGRKPEALLLNLRMKVS